MVSTNVDVFLYLGVIVIIAAVLAYLLRLIKQPQILAYVLVGIFLPPLFQWLTGLVLDQEVIRSMSIIGIAFLLFIVGIEADLRKLKNVALVSTLGGGISILVLFGLGYLLALLLGYLSIEAAYLGLMLTFSSTMVVLKILSDKHELSTLHGRIILGILLLQDLVAILAISVLSAVNGFTLALFGLALLKFVFLFGVAWICSKLLFPKVFRFAAKHQELLLITSLAVCFLFSLAFHYLGFSIAIGAFLAGLTLGNLDYNVEIVGKVKSLRDFFSLIFFVSLGLGLSFAVMKDLFWPILIFMLFLLIVKPIIIMLICVLFNYTKKPSFLSSLALANMGEFALIIATAGYYEYGHLSQETFSLVVIVTLISITATSYLMSYDYWFYRKSERLLRIFDRLTSEGSEFAASDIKPKIVLCGHDRLGFSILRKLDHVKKKVLVVDFNPEVINQLARQGYHCLYGEITDQEIHEKMNLAKLEMLISTIPDENDTMFLIKKIRAVNRSTIVIVTAFQVEDALKFYKLGADYVILPHFLGGEHVANLISGVHSHKINLKRQRECHLQHLLERQELGQEHPARSA